MPSIELNRPLDLRATVGQNQMGRHDPTVRFDPSGFWWATRTASGPATLHLHVTPGRVHHETFGPGADDLEGRVAALVGQHDDPSALEAHHPEVERAAHRNPGLRIGATGSVMHALVPAILGQRVTGHEAGRSWRSMCRLLGGQAPGPGELLLPPDPRELVRQPSWWFHRLGVERRRAEAIKLAASRCDAIERLAGRGAAAASAALRSLPGIGEWTAAEVVSRALGDPDAVSVGDYHLKNVISWALAREPRGTDERMLELLAPYAGQRGRVVRLLLLDGHGAPAFGPRQAILPIAEL